MYVSINQYSIDRASPFCIQNVVETFVLDLFYYFIFYFYFSSRGKCIRKPCLQVVLLQVQTLRSLELLVQDKQAGPHLQVEKK
jgi:hypothetical protein